MKYSFPAFENGFIRAAAISPALRVADCTYNAAQIVEAMQAFAAENVHLLCLPELSLTGYTCSDLFLQDTLLRGAEKALCTIFPISRETRTAAETGREGRKLRISRASDASTIKRMTIFSSLIRVLI